MRVLKCLAEAIETTPIPTAPPRLTREGAGIGLTLLDVALGASHVRRMTDHVFLLDHQRARRSTEIEVDLDLLSRDQRDSLRAFGVHAYRTTAVPDPVSHKRLWVPISRSPRGKGAGIEVRDAGGRTLPRLARPEFAELLAAGLYRIFRGILSSRPSTEEHHAHELVNGHQPLWLIFASIHRLIAEQAHPVHDDRHEHRTNPTEKSIPRNHREAAHWLILEYRDTLDQYLQLLDIAVHSHFLIVGMEDSENSQILTYEQMMLDIRRSSNYRGVWSSLQEIRKNGAVAYEIAYDNHVSSNLLAYYLEVESEPSVEIRRLYLTTSFDGHFTSRISSDLTTCANAIDERRRTQEDRHLVTLQTHTACRRLGQLIGHRKWEAGQSKIDVEPIAIFPKATELSEAASKDINETGGLRLLEYPEISSLLRSAAIELDRDDADLDLAVYNGPRSNQAHAHWRRRTTEPGKGHGINLSAVVQLRDASDSGARSVSLYCAAVAVYIYLLGALLTRSPFVFDSPATNPPQSIAGGAVATLLLLVPGYMYSRLALPRRSSISGRLRDVPRGIALASIGVTALLASLVVTGVYGWPMRLGFLILPVALLGAAVFLRYRWRAGNQPSRTHGRINSDFIARTGGPIWAYGIEGSPRREVEEQSRRWQPSAKFDEIGSAES